MAAEATKTLIIAEKPSVAGDIVKALPGKFEKHEAYYESDQHVVSFAIGHLVSIATPKDMDERLKSWSLDILPIIPEKFIIAPLPKTKGQLSTLAKLLRRKDIKEIINACDAGREGELIFRYILQYVSETKPVKASIKRLWLQSMTKTAIEEGFKHLRTDVEMQNLAQAAMCRSEADWLIGINGSRALTGYKSQWGGFFLMPCGRVQTPTLSMLVRREWDREKFVPKDYWEVHGEFAAGAGTDYAGRWFDPAFRKGDDEDTAKPDKGETAKADPTKAERIWDKARAESIVAKCLGKPAQVTETQKPSSQGAPQLYDLTSLQREANARFGFSAKNTLGLAQALYERHKVLTYPRTDSRYLPNDYLAVAKGLMESLQGSDYGKFAKEALAKGYVRMDKRIFDDAKVSDHHAIIPTNVMPGELSEPERRIYQTVVQRFLAIFFPPARFLNTTRISIVEGEHFRTEGKVLEEPGWKAIYGIDKQEEAILTPLKAGAKYVAKDVTLKQDATRPPPRLNESTLLSFMESAGKYVEDEALADAMKERGLGTPATRAAIIEGLLYDKYIVREGKELVPTAKGADLMRLLSAIGIEELVSPELTGGWEFKLNRIERGLYTRPEFMKEIVDLARSIVSKIKGYDEDKDKKEAPFGNPIDGKPMYETLTRYESADGEIMIRKVLGGRQMSEAEVFELLQKRQIGPLQGFRSKAGKPFTAVLKLNEKNKVEFVFDDTASGADGQPLDISKEEPVGISPVDGTKVYETLTGYVSESALNGDKTGLKINKMILGKTLDRAIIQRLLSLERTDLIKGFQSSKTRRFFDAYLKLSKEGKISFEFPPREFKGRGKKKAVESQGDGAESPAEAAEAG
ncbi:MAG: DNA topoisomerase III [Fibrobacteres bacterium]|nr:DNA topoisomerase III [Fibrobacterota bacterium]